MNFESELNSARNEGYMQGLESGLRHYQEIVKSEADEWSSVLAQVAPEHYRDVIEAILLIGWVQEITTREEARLMEMKNHHIPVPQALTEEAENTISEARKSINELRGKFNLPPKYTESN